MTMMTKGDAIQRLTDGLNISGRRALQLIDTLPSPYASDEALPLEMIEELIKKNSPPASVEDFNALLRPDKSSPPDGGAIQIRSISVAAGPNGSYVAALDHEENIWLWVEGGIAWQQLPRVKPLEIELPEHHGTAGADIHITTTMENTDKRGAQMDVSSQEKHGRRGRGGKHNAETE